MRSLAEADAGPAFKLHSYDDNIKSANRDDVRFVSDMPLIRAYSGPNSCLFCA